MLPERGCWFPPTVFTDVSPAHRIAREEIFGPVLSVLTFRTPGRGGREGATTRTYGLSAGVWTEKGSRILCDGRPAPGRGRVGQHVQPLRPDEPVRRLSRSRASAARAAATGSGRTSMSDARASTVRKTYKLYIGGAFPRSESGRSYVVDCRRRRVPRQRRAGLAQGRPRRGRRRRAAALKGWSAATRLQPRPGALPRRRDARGPPRPVRRRRPRRRGHDRAQPRRQQVDAAIDRWVWYAGWTDKVAQVAGSSNPVAGPVLQLLGARADRASSGVVAPPSSSLLGLVSVLAPAIAAGNTVVVVADERRPLPAVTLTEVLAHLRLPGGVVNLLTGPAAELAPVLAAHRDVDGLDLAGAPRRARRRRRGRGRDQHQAGARRGRDHDWTRDPGTGAAARASSRPRRSGTPIGV